MFHKFLLEIQFTTKTYKLKIVTDRVDGNRFLRYLAVAFLFYFFKMF